MGDDHICACQGDPARPHGTFIEMPTEEHAEMLALMWQATRRLTCQSPAVSAQQVLAMRHNRSLAIRHSTIVGNTAQRAVGLAGPVDRDT
jgi:hypothetical protein